MLADLIERSRADARSQRLRQFIYVERHLCEREIGELVAETISDALYYLTGMRLEVSNLKAVETSRTMVAWEADAGRPDGIFGLPVGTSQPCLFTSAQPGLFSDLPCTAAIKFATDFSGEIVRITSPIFYQRVKA